MSRRLAENGVHYSTQLIKVDERNNTGHLFERGAITKGATYLMCSLCNGRAKIDCELGKIAKIESQPSMTCRYHVKNYDLTALVSVAENIVTNNLPPWTQRLRPLTMNEDVGYAATRSFEVS